ncbi:uncharacterized protein LOC133869800 isoform X2 [Alnus glutinosa]|uniref:uncharacterized protein LOC133869800 isoform X2 n=1 Tax=Alnus glutinosa TaxID=3517 RepID=UPI002D76E450|nr:uncharacterized protein LOC133869800 isoform X2 [Alnus glutinosa]
MPKPNEEEESDGLEITSIGSLYKGPWDKKYWSSSRGKDRYPYPVGYQVVRAHNGSTYKMEIHEGPKGPLFVITSDGHSGSGQTPGIAWEKFQKKGCPRMKIWHGKRFSGKIDGVEFFGFKNQLVQRLLRELVANVNGTAERSLFSSSSVNGASKTEHDSRRPDACTYPDTGKRSRKREILSTSSVGGARLKRSRPPDLICDAEAPSLIQGNQRNYTHTCFRPPSPGALPASGCLVLETGEEKSYFSAKDGPPLYSPDFSDHLREEVLPAQEERELDGSENCKSAGVANNLPAEEKPLGRSPDTQVEEFNLQNATEDQNGNALVPKDFPDVNDVDLCAPDTLDPMQNNTSNYAPSTQDKSTYGEKEELTAANMVISEGLLTESHPQEEIGTSGSIASSEKSDYDSVGQEMAKSMMTFLLPQAIPLLKKASRKKKAMVSPSKIVPCMVKSQWENNEARYTVDVPPPVVTLAESAHMEKEERHIQNTVLNLVGQSFEHANSVVLDSFEDDQCGDLATKQVILYSDIAEADLVSFEEDTCPPNTWGQLIVQNESSVSRVETSGSKDIFCYSEVHMTLNEKPQDGDMCISESVLACTSPSDNVLPENTNACANLDENPLDVELHSGEKHFNIVPDCTIATDASDTNQRGTGDSSQISSKEISVNGVVAEPGITSFTQTPNKVYPWKTVRNVDLLARKNNVPLSESIIHRNFGEHLDPETDPATGTFLSLEIHQMDSSDDKPGQKDSVAVQARLGGQSHSLHTENTTMNFESVINNMAPAVSQNQAFAFASNDKDTSDVFQPSVSVLAKSQVHLDEEMLGHKNLVDSNSPTSFLNQKTSFCENNSSSAKGVQASVDMNRRKVELNNELQNIVELVGCYVHPMPITSLLLSTKGNEIYICVLCGLLMDRDRTLFIYKLGIKEPRVGCPSFVGHTFMTLPILKNHFGREVEVERSGLQFTPDGQHLVLLDNIKTPYCREGRIQCLCSTCTSDCSEENAVKIVQVKFGYVSIVVKLKTVESLHCILVCEPNHLVAVGETGRLHLWVMNSVWSAQIEEFILPANDCTSPGIMELKGIPKSTSLVVGHHGFGEFSIWDISKRILLSSFCAPSTSIYQFFPISLFSWKNEGPGFSNSNVEEHVNGIMAATKMWFSESSENSSFLPSEGEDVAVWLLVSTISDSNAQHNFIQSDRQNHSVGCWRLALLVKNMVILGTALDLRAAAVGASAGHGIIGTSDGLVYMWELSTGTKLAMLHHFRGSSVSCVATDGSTGGALAVAGGDQLLVYLQITHTQKSS